MQYAVSTTGATLTKIVPIKRIESYLATIGSGQFATVTQIPDEEVLYVWEISKRGFISLLGEFSEDDETSAIELASCHTINGTRCIVLSKALGRPSFNFRNV